MRIKLNFKLTTWKNNDIKGFTLNRPCTTRECRYIMRNILKINIGNRDEYDSLEEYKDYNEGMCDTVNQWLEGLAGDEEIMEYAYDSSDDQLGLWNAFSVAMYLTNKNIIKKYE